MDLYAKASEVINTKLLVWWESIAAKLPNFLLALLVFAIFYVVSGYISRLFRKSLRRVKTPESVKELMQSVVQVLLICLGLFFALGIIGLDKTVVSLLAGVGVIGLALGFAFQDIASNLISGIFIAVKGPFDLGHIIKMGDVFGTVEDIRLRDTVIRNFSGQLIYVPNKTFMGTNLINFHKTGERRIEIIVGVGYESDIEQASQVIKTALDALDGVKKDKPCEVVISEFAGSAINLIIWVWVDYPAGDFLGVTNKSMVAIKKALADNSINIPFPIRTLEFGAESRKALLNRQ